jgi:hypothetical protein
MTLDELRSTYEEARKIIRKERRMRQFVFRFDEATRRGKVQEMDQLLRLVAELKDALKPHCEADYEQPRLLDVPRKAEYP